MKTRLLFCSALLLCGITGHAAPPAETPPAKPFVANAPASSQWTVTYKPKSAEKKPATAEEDRARKMRLRYSPLPLARRVIKAPGKMVIYTTLEAGMKSEAWLVGEFMYELPTREGASIQVSDKSREDFPELSWLSDESFRGTVELNKHKVYLFETAATDKTTDTEPPQAGGEPKKPADKPDKVPSQRAYIDVETRLPVELDTETMVMTYEFAKPPAVFPEMDEKVAQQIKPRQG